MAEGYGTRFHSPIDNAFVCSICLGVLQDPKQCENNEHYFCSGCIKKHLENTQNCPACQDKLTVETLRKAPRIVSECISRYKISCDYAERGCDVVVEVRALQEHVRECDFMPVTCSNEDCGEVVNKRDVKEHELDLCRFKTMTTCDDCGEKMPRHKYGGHGCVLRRDVDEMKKDLAEMKIMQYEMLKEMRQGIKRSMIGVKSTQTSECISSVEPNIKQDSKVDGEKFPINTDHETDEKLESDFDEQESESDDEEDISPRSWFKSTVLNSNYEVKNRYKDALRSLDWVKACAVAPPNKKIGVLHLLILYKKGESASMAQLQECFGEEIVPYVEFIPEITYFKLEMNRHWHGESPHGKSPQGAPKQCQAICVRSGDGIYLENEGRDSYGTIGFSVRSNNKLFLSTCYHVCYRGKKLPEDKGKAHQILLHDCQNKKSLTRTARFCSLPIEKNKEEQSHKDVNRKNEGKMPKQKEGTKGCEESNINEEDYSNTTANVETEGAEKTQEQKTMKLEGGTKELDEEDKTVKQGSFFWGCYDKGHDIGFIEQGLDAKCVCPIPASYLKKKIPRKRKIGLYIEAGFCTVQKTGYSTGTRKGRIRGFNYCDLGTSATTNAGLVVEDEDSKLVFASPGDSGSLVLLIKDEEEIPIAYLTLSGTTEENGENKNVHFCHFLVELLRKCRKTEEVGYLQLYLTGCVCNGPAFEI